MIHLHTLGDSRISVGGKDFRPNAPLVFAVLLYLGLERGHRVPRAALQELLFPESDERSGAHSLRQLLYKLRQLGVQPDSDAVAVWLPSDSVTVDFDESQAGASSDSIRQLSMGIVPGFTPPSEAYAIWLDEKRTTIIGRFRAQILTELREARNSGDAAATERISSSLLRIDPLNEEATFARAEALALCGQKREAVQLLERYAAEVGETSAQLRLAPDLLRKRIMERVDASERSRIPLIGRKSDLAWLLAQFKRASEGAPTITVIWGDAGIGKTRLVEEFSAHLVFRRVQSESAHCQPHDVDRPLGALIDLIPRLLAVRGALAISTESMRCLRQLVGGDDAGPTPAESDRLTFRIRASLAELLASIATEAPFALVIEDAHWLDDESTQLLLRTVPSQSVAFHLVMTKRDRPTFGKGTRLSENVFVRRLEPLDNSSSEDLLRHATPGDRMSESVRVECVALGLGNPLFLISIAEHLRLQGSAPSSRTHLVDLLRQRTRMLEPHSLLLLRTIAAFGNHATTHRLEAATGLQLPALLLALQDLSDRGLVTRHETGLKCSHMLLADAVIADTPTVLGVPIFERVAKTLESDSNVAVQPGLLWTVADAWRSAANDAAAHRALLRLVEYAKQTFQSELAAAALEKDQEVCDESEREAVIEATIDAASAARAYAAIIRNVDKYEDCQHARGLTLSRSNHHALRRTLALWKSGESIGHIRDELLGFAANAAVGLSSRITAVRAILYQAMRDMVLPESTEMIRIIDELVNETNGSWDTRDLRMFYHAYFGDLNKALGDAEALYDWYSSQSEHAFPDLTNLGVVLFYGDRLDLSKLAFQELIARAERWSSHIMAGQLYGQLAAALYYSGDLNGAQEMHLRGAEHVRKHDPKFASLHLANTISLGIVTNNWVEVHEAMDRLSRYPEATAPASVRMLKACEIQIASAEGTLDSAIVDLESLVSIDDAGREAVEHQDFAVSLCLAYDAAGSRSKGLDRMRQYLVRRRERYPLSGYLQLSVRDKSLRNDLERLQTVVAGQRPLPVLHESGFAQ
jgi:DNA-binding SARP family transcriptional activator